MRIGILGGSFDPVHKGHLGVARATVEALGLDGVWLMPAAQAPLRERSVRAGPEARWEMLRLALEEEADTNRERRIERCAIELERGGTSYTVDTLRELKTRHPDHAWTWIVGDDQFARLGSWREPAVLAELADWAVYSRPGFDSGAVPEVPGLRVQRVVCEKTWTVSSTEVRRRLGAGETVSGLVPDKVIEYIRQNRLYGAF